MQRFQIILFTSIILCSFCLNAQIFTKDKSFSQDSIIKRFFYKPYQEFGFFAPETRLGIDSGLSLDSSITFLWQRKSELANKRGQFEVGLSCLNVAVQQQPSLLPYRGFMKCIFMHDYNGAINDFMKCRSDRGNMVEMEHSYDFYIALSYLQLQEFEKAELIFKTDIDSITKAKNNDWVHHLELYYLGISQYEQMKYQQAIETFDLALEKYPEFSEVLYYQSICCRKIDEKKKSQSLKEKAISFGKKGYTINDDNVIHVRYPYQVRWDLF